MERAAGSRGTEAVESGRSKDIRDWIGKTLLVADGSTGTALESLKPGIGAAAALLPLTDPELVARLHKAYFDAGSMLVETATFSSNARSLERFRDSSVGGSPVGGASGFKDTVTLAYELNKAAASIARKAADDAAARTGSPRWVAGSMGPGEAPPSFGMSTWQELRESYLPQARGLADGGADLAIVETCQDPLQIKAALSALASLQGGRGLPFIVSATVENSGRMLAGTSVEAFVAIVAPFKPLALGVNCSGGPDELAPILARLAVASPLPLCFMPNAGIPVQTENGTVFPFGPREFAGKVGVLVRLHRIAIAGGCCGTGPEHIEALARELADAPEPCASSATALHPSSLASLYEVCSASQSPFIVGEKANVSGSASFAALLEEEDFDGMGEVALDQEAAGAGALDLRVARPGREEGSDFKELVTSIALRARSALSLDTTNPDAAEMVLPLSGGRMLLNCAASLGDEARARRFFALAREHGAAVVCLALGPEGAARDATEAASLCRKLLDMATGEFGLPAGSLFFDPAVFPLNSAPGRAGIVLESISAIKEACPGSSTILGLGNLSHGMKAELRKPLEAVFLQLALRRGLDAVILDPESSVAVESLDPALREALESWIAGASPS